MSGIDERTELMLGKDKTNILKNKCVAIFGLGGVGGYAFESLVRIGIGHIHVVDNDSFDESNINRQILAVKDTIGMLKTDAAKMRALSIRDDIKVTQKNIFVLKDNVEDAFRIKADSDDDNEILIRPDYIIDCIDTVTAKLSLVKYAKENNIPIISSMGTGNKIDAARLEVADIFETSVCPLCKVMRRELRALGINELKVVYSREEPLKSGGRTPGSIAFVPGTAGLILAGEAVKELLK